MGFLVTLLGAILPSLADSVVQGLFGLLKTEIDRRAAQQQGVDAQVAADDKKAAEVAEAVAVSEAQPVDVEGRLKNGSF